MFGVVYPTKCKPNIITTILEHFLQTSQEPWKQMNLGRGKDERIENLGIDITLGNTSQKNKHGNGRRATLL